MRAAVRRGVIENDGGTVTICCRTIDDYDRTQLIAALLATMDGTWWSRDDAIVASSRYLGFQRTGRNIKAAFRSAINGGIRRGMIERDGQRIRKQR
jgi:hypothetical protein